MRNQWDEINSQPWAASSPGNPQEIPTIHYQDISRRKAISKVTNRCDQSATQKKGRTEFGNHRGISPSAHVDNVLIKGSLVDVPVFHNPLEGIRIRPHLPSLSVSRSLWSATTDDNNGCSVMGWRCVTRKIPHCSGTPHYIKTGPNNALSRPIQGSKNPL